MYMKYGAALPIAHLYHDLLSFWFFDYTMKHSIEIRIYGIKVRIVFHFIVETSISFEARI